MALAVPSPDGKGSRKQMGKHTKSCLLELKLVKVVLIISGLQPGIPSSSVRPSLPKDKENRASKQIFLSELCAFGSLWLSEFISSTFHENLKAKTAKQKL